MSTERPIKLYEFPPSPNCQRVKVVLEEKKLPYESIHIDLRKKEQKKPDFLKLNPNGKVPVIVDRETVLYESRIINEYLEDQYPEPPLMPKTPARRAKIRLLIDYALTDLIPPLCGNFFRKFFFCIKCSATDFNLEVIQSSQQGPLLQSLARGKLH